MDFVDRTIDSRECPDTHVPMPLISDILNQLSFNNNAPHPHFLRPADRSGYFTTRVQVAPGRHVDVSIPRATIKAHKRRSHSAHPGRPTLEQVYELLGVESLPGDEGVLDGLRALMQDLVDKHDEQWVRDHRDQLISQWEAQGQWM